jgi:sulfur-oxidizing protein SoxX
MSLKRGIVAVVLAALPVATPTAGDLEAAIRGSFQARNQAGLDRLERNPMQAACSGPVGMPIPKDRAEAIQNAALATVKLPADGQYLGDWQAGEKVAQTGTGMQYSDDPAMPNGGNCYACHQLAPKEIAYGTLGPSLTGYGRQRGQSAEMLKYTWTRLWNSHAYNACSHMPRFGEAGILTEQQLKDVMALLFDPASPVNQ